MGDYFCDPNVVTFNIYRLEENEMENTHFLFFHRKNLTGLKKYTSVEPAFDQGEKRLIEATHAMGGLDKSATPVRP